MLVSTISGIYAAFLFSNSIFVGVTLGIIWGVLLTSINRLLFLSKGTLSLNIVYLLLSIAVSITISTPLLLKIFESSTNADVYNRRDANVAKINSQNVRELAYKTAELTRHREQLITGADGTGGTHQAGMGPAFYARMGIIRTDSAEINSIRQKIADSRRQIIDKPIGLFEKLNSFTILLQSSTTAVFESLLVSFFILIIEILPYFLRLTTRNGYYEQLIESQENSTTTSLVSNEPSTSEAGTEARNSFELFCYRIIEDLEAQMKQNRVKAEEMLRNGLIIIFSAILFYMGIAYYLIAIFFETHVFKTQYIYFMISLSLLFLFLQFLGGWYLQQHKSSLKTVLYLNSIKPDIHKFILAYLAIIEFTPENERQDQLKELLTLLNTGKNFDNAIMSLQENHFVKDLISSIDGLKSMIEKLPPGK